MISVCVIITSGSNQHLDGIEADITITDITTSKGITFTQIVIILLLFPDFADYSFLDRTVTFPIGATAGDTMCQTITLALEGEIGENDETFSLQLSPPAVGTSLVDVADTVKTVTIEDADSESIDAKNIIYMHNQMSYIRTWSLLMRNEPNYRRKSRCCWSFVSDGG